MNSHQMSNVSNQPSSRLFLLPKLKEDSSVQQGAVGEWHLQEAKVYQDVAVSLALNKPGQQLQNVTSIPNIWARPLLVETALHQMDYPIRLQVIDQWRGMLAAIALAELRNFPLKAVGLELKSLKEEERLAHSLCELLPAPVHVLYQRPDRENPWQDVYVFLWDGKPVGMTSPSTLVCPAEVGEWNSLPWWDATGQRLRSPISHLTPDEKGLLWRWLKDARASLDKYQGTSDLSDPIHTVGTLIDDFCRDLSQREPESGLELSDNAQFFGVPINKGVLILLNRPIKARSKPSNVKLVALSDKTDLPDLLIIDPAISGAWAMSPQDICVYETVSLASLDLEDLRNGKVNWRNAANQPVTFLEADQVLLPQFVFIREANALPGSLLPKGTEKLTYKGKAITPFLSVNPRLLDYFTPEELVKRTTCESTNGGIGVKVTLNLPLSGFQDGKPPKDYHISREYALEEQNAIAQVPILEVWPNFCAEGWKEYYAFYYDGEYGADTFKVSIPSVKDSNRFNEKGGEYEIAYFEQFPMFLQAQNTSQQLLGVIPLKSPPQISTGNAGFWRIGVDFGTSFTNVYINQNDLIKRFPVEILHLPITDSDEETRSRVLIEYFITVDGDIRDCPFSSVLTTANSSRPEADQIRIMLDGRIYIPKDHIKFKPQELFIKTGLKWSRDKLIFTKLFLKNLALQITALAVKEKVRKIQWSLSYPSAFSKRDRDRYTANWQELLEDLEKTTGIEHLFPDADSLQFFRPESLAVAQYFADEERHNLVRTTCIDIGGGTSDISVWEDNRLIHQCSVQFAGKDLFSYLIELNPRFLERHFSTNATGWQGLRDTNFYAKLDVLLRRESDNWLRRRRDLVVEEKEVQGLLQLIALSFAGLYYYVGIILRVLFAEGKYSCEETTSVYLGGNGSRFLNWLAAGGRFDSTREVNNLLSRMMHRGAGFPEEVVERTQLGQKLKDEVACGLVLSHTKLAGLDDKEKRQDLMIAGEECELNEEKVSWNARLPIGGKKITSFRMSRKLKLVKLPEFLQEFNLALTDLDIEEITPLDLKDSARLWRDVEKELTTLVLQVNQGESDNIRVEAPFLLALKALIRVLGKQWADKYRNT